MTDVENKTTLLNENKVKDEAKKEGKKFKRDPIKVKHVVLNSDFYALTWNACRKKAWTNERAELVEGKKISLTASDDFNLRFGFIIFVIVVLTTVGVLLYESFASDAYKDATWPIVVLRITLVSFSQELIKPEIFQGVSLLRYSFKHPGQFNHSLFAKFVAFFQAFVATVTFTAIFFFCCMADEALELIMNFAGLAVISELDDWVGDQIMAEKLYINYNDKKYKNNEIDFESINERMGLFTKLCVIGKDLEIIDDQNDTINDSFLYSIFSTIHDYIPYSLIPLLTIPCQYLLVYIQNYGGKAHQKKH